MNKYPKSTVSAIAWKLPKRNNIRLSYDYWQAGYYLMQYARKIRNCENN
jgi:hypothetical protein